MVPDAGSDIEFFLYKNTHKMDRRLQQPEDEPSFGQALKAQLFAPEVRQGNLNIALSLTVFAGAVVFLRNFGDLLAV